MPFAHEAFLSVLSDALIVIASPTRAGEDLQASCATDELHPDRPLRHATHPDLKIGDLLRVLSGPGEPDTEKAA